MSRKKRVLILGIDGATFDIINPLLSEDKLPNFQKIIDDGTYGTLKSILQPVSATCWTSLVTGKNPGKYDVYGFYDKFNGSYEHHLINSHSVKAKKIWDILGEHKRKSIIMNIPITYPPTTINGIMISGLSTHPEKKFTYPEHLSNELYNKNYIIDIFCHFREDIESYMELALNTITGRQQVFKELLQKNDWDFSMVVFTTPDRLQHTIWHQENQIQQIYITLDQLIGEIIDESLDDNTYLLIVSDHGFKSINRKFFVNEWLWELGLLSKEISTQKASIPDFWEDQFGRNGESKNISKFLATTGITKDNIRSVVPDTICEVIKKVAPASLRKIFPKENLIISWNKTKAYFSSQFSQGININLKGREPHGIVEPGKEYEQLRDYIIHELYRLKDPHTFENIVDEVCRGEDYFFGEYEAHAPDIIFVTHNYNYLLDSNKRTSRHVICNAQDDYPVFSQHDPKGIFLMTGPAVKSGNKVFNMNIFDIAPTVLNILNIPVPNDMDGKILYNVIENDESGYSEEQINYRPISNLDTSLIYQNSLLMDGTAL